MPPSDYYWSRHSIQGFGKMWFLIVPQEADANGGGRNLLGSVVEDRDGGIFNRNYPRPEKFDEPQLILKALKARRRDLGISDSESIVSEVNFSDLNIAVQKSDKVISEVDGFPGLPNLRTSLKIDYSRMQNISIQFGKNTRKLLIPLGYLSRLKHSVGGDDKKIAPSISIDKETIIYQILLTDQYSVTFESTSIFNADFEANIQVANTLNVGKAAFELEQSNRKQVTVKVNDGKDYLIAIEDIDWDNID